MSRRGPRRLSIDFEKLLVSDEQLAKFDASRRADGYLPTSARLWRRRNGTYTARVVWRNRAEIVSTFTYTIVGLVLR